MSLPWVTACHEAAHCVAILLCGEIVHEVVASKEARMIVDRRGRERGPLFGLVEGSLSPLPPDVAATMLQLARDGEQRRMMWRIAANCVFVDAAGAVAEAKAGRRGWVDTCTFNQYVEGDWERSLGAIRPYVADERERQQLAMQMWNLSRPVLSRRPAWDAVEAVARALQANGGRLNGAQVERAVKSVLGELPKQDWSRPIVAIEAPRA